MQKVESMLNSKNTYTVGELAKSYDVTRDTIRLYHKKGLLAPSEVSKNRYRSYDVKDIACLNYIMTLKKLNLSLKEIDFLVNKSGLQENRDIITNQVMTIDQKIEELTKLKAILKEYDELFHRSIHELNQYRICKSPTIAYKVLTESLDTSMKEVTHISHDRIPFFTYMIEKAAFNSPSYKDLIITSEGRGKIAKVALSFNYDKSIDELAHTTLNTFSFPICINAIIRCYTDKDYSQLVAIKEYMNSKGYQACGPMISRLLFINNNKSDSADYYEIWIPLEAIKEDIE